MSVDGGHWPRIGQLLLEQGHLTGDQLHSALAQQEATGEMLGEILVARGHITRLDLASAIGTQWHWQQPPVERDVDEEPSLAALVENLSFEEPMLEPEAAPAPVESYWPIEPVMEPLETEATAASAVVAAVIQRIEALEEKARLIDDLQARLRTANEHSAAADARLDMFESLLNEFAKTQAALRSELASQTDELGSLRGATHKFDALAAAARALLT